MHVTLIRHGRAVSSTTELGDSGRVLSKEGREQVRNTASGVASQDVKPTDVLSSPLVRAVQTAELIAAGLDYRGEIEAYAWLRPEGRVSELIDHLGQLDTGSDVVFCGHEPFMSSAASALLGYHVSGFGTGVAFRIELDVAEAGRGDLLWRWLAGQIVR